MPPKATNANVAKKNSTPNKQEKKPKGSVKVNAKDAKNLKNPVKGAGSQKSPKNNGSKSPSKSPKNNSNAKKTKKGEEDSEGKKSKNRFADVEVEKGVVPNKKTGYINGKFNVNYAGDALKKFIQQTLGYNLGIMNAQFPYSAIAEVIALYIVSDSGKFNTKNSKKADLYEVTLENVLRAVRESSEYGPELKCAADKFDSTEADYVATFYDSEKVLREFLVEKSFANTTNVTINNDALNFVAYMLSRALSRLAKTACILSEYANKKNVMIKNFRYACDVHFTGKLHNLLMQRLDEIERLFLNVKEGENGEGEEEKEEDEGDEGDEEEGDKPAKNAKGKNKNQSKAKGNPQNNAKGKGAKSKNKDEENEADDADDGDDQDNDAGSDAESDNDED